MGCARARAGSLLRARTGPSTTPTPLWRPTRSLRRTTASCSSERRKPNPPSPALGGRTSTRTDADRVGSRLIIRRCLRAPHWRTSWKLPSRFFQNAFHTGTCRGSTKAPSPAAASGMRNGSRSRIRFVSGRCGPLGPNAAEVLRKLVQHGLRPLGGDEILFLLVELERFRGAGSRLFDAARKPQDLGAIEEDVAAQVEVVATLQILAGLRVESQRKLDVSAQRRDLAAHSS